MIRTDGKEAVLIQNQTSVSGNKGRGRLVPVHGRDVTLIRFAAATQSLRDAFLTRLEVPDGKPGAIAAVHTFGDRIFKPERTILWPESAMDS